MATYDNDLRLKEIATGDESGTWGTSTNTNLELISDAFGYGTKAMAADSDETFTIPDFSADATRGMFLNITSAVSLTTTRVVTLGPNTVSKLWIIDNATTGGQIITIKQGSGATVNIANGDKAMVVTDGAGAGAAVFSANPSGTTGTVTSVGGTGTVSGLTLTGTVTSSGNLTLGGTLANIDLTSGVTGTLPVDNGGTGATTLTGVLKGNGTSAVTASDVDLTSEVTGTLPVANGGTGATTLTANNVLLGNGTSAPLAVAPSTSGNVLTSNGSTWQSSAAPASAVTPLNLTLISGSDFASGSASQIEFTSLSGYYDYYLLFSNDLNMGGSVNPTVTLSSDNGSSYSFNIAASGNSRSFGLRSNGGWSGQSDSDQTRIWTNSNYVTAYTYIWGLAKSQQVYFTTYYYSGRENAGYYGWQNGRSNNSTTNINALKYQFGGTATSGAVYLYGVRM